MSHRCDCQCLAATGLPCNCEAMTAAELRDDEASDPYDPDGDDADCCSECWEPFRYDDTGGYNPPCSCGLHCGRCHDILAEREAEDHRDEDDRDEDDQR